VVTSATSDVANPTAKRDECDEAYAENMSKQRVKSKAR
jgi:hypothetical protein